MSQYKKKINLALQGGGSHGALTWGALDSILESNLEIDSISATSAGAMNAVFLLQGYLTGGKKGAQQALKKFWMDVSEYGKIVSPIKKTFWETELNVPIENTWFYFLFYLTTKLFSPYQFNYFNINPLRTILEKSLDFDLIRKSKEIKLFICATNEQTGKVKIFTNEELTIEAILASACIPTLFQSITKDHEYYWNGGYMGNPAIFPLIYNSDSHDILIIHLNPIIRNEIPKSPNEILNRINEISFNSSLMREIRAISFVTKLIDEKWVKEEYVTKLKKVYMHSIRSDKFMVNFSVVSKLNTDWKFLNQLYEIGRNCTVDWINQNFDKIGVESTMDLNEFL